MDARRGTVVNVCFHGIGAPGRDLEPGEDRYWIRSDDFRRILDTVVEDRRVHLSFDDGNASDVELVLPALLERELQATFFVIAGRLDQKGSLGSDQVRHLAERGMRIGLHGMDHRPWRGLTDREAARELVESRGVIEEVSGREVCAAALPLGRYDRTTLARLRRLGYAEVDTSDRRWARAGDWLQPRISLVRDDTPASIRRTILRPPSLGHRARTGAVGLVKRLR